MTGERPSNAPPGRPAVFFDRDNTLLHDPGYLRDLEAVRLIPGTTQALRRLKSSGYMLVVVTNQSGVARGLMTEDDVRAVNKRMQSLLVAEGVTLDGIYYCPYLEGDEALRPEYRRESDLRKPRPGMLLVAAKDLGLSLCTSWMVGDSERDVHAGRAAGCKTILLATVMPVNPTPADFTVTRLSEAVDVILQQ